MMDVLRGRPIPALYAARNWRSVESLFLMHGIKWKLEELRLAWKRCVHAHLDDGSRQLQPSSPVRRKHGREFLGDLMKATMFQLEKNDWKMTGKQARDIGWAAGKQYFMDQRLVDAIQVIHISLCFCLPWCHRQVCWMELLLIRSSSMKPSLLPGPLLIQGIIQYNCLRNSKNEYRPCMVSSISSIARTHCGRWLCVGIIQESTSYEQLPILHVIEWSPCHQPSFLRPLPTSFVPHVCLNVLIDCLGMEYRSVEFDSWT